MGGFWGSYRFSCSGLYAHTALQPNAWEYPSSMQPRIRRTLSLLAAVVLLVMGLYAANFFSGNIEVKTVLAEGTVRTPANDYNYTTYQAAQAGIYHFKVSSDAGKVKVYVNDEKPTGAYWINGIECELKPKFYGTQGEFQVTLIGEPSQPIKNYLVFANLDSTDKEITYEVSRIQTYNNYIALTAAIALATSGAILLASALLGDKLHEFNRALENQE